MLSKRKKTTLIVIASILAGILLTVCIIFFPRPVSMHLPKEEILKVEMQYMSTGEIHELPTEQIPKFSEKLNSIWYINRINFSKHARYTPVNYVITYESVNVRVSDCGISVYTIEDDGSIDEFTVNKDFSLVFPIEQYNGLHAAFIDWLN